MRNSEDMKYVESADEEMSLAFICFSNVILDNNFP